MDIFDLSAKLTLNKSEYEDGLNDATTDASNFGSKLASGLGTAGKVAGAALVGVGSAVAGVSAYVSGAISDTAEYADSIDKASQKLGISSTAYQEWEAVLQHSGTSMDSMGTSFRKLATAVQDGSADQQAAFEQIGLSMDALKGMSTEEVFASVISGLQGMEEGTERTALATELLGKGAMELGPLLNTSAEDTKAMIDQVNALGGVMDEASIKAGAGFQDSLQDLQTSFSGLKNNLMGEFLPSVTTVMDGLTKLMTGDNSGIGQISQGVGNLVDGILNALPSLVETGAQIIESIGQAIIQNLPMLIDCGVDVVLELGQGIIDNLPLIVDAALQVILALATGLGEALPDLIPTIVDVVLTIVDTLINNVDLMIDAAIALITGLATGLIEAVPILIEKAPEIVIDLVDALIRNAPKLLIASLELITTLASGLISALPKLLAKVPEIMNSLKDKFISFVSNFADIGKNIVDGIWDGITGAWDNMVQKVKEKVDALVETVKGALDIHSPSRVFKQIGDYCVQGFELGFEPLGSGAVLNGLEDKLTDLQGVEINSGAGIVYQQTINVNQQISTADELAKRVRLESRYGLMRGVALG